MINKVFRKIIAPNYSKLDGRYCFYCSLTIFETVKDDLPYSGMNCQGNRISQACRQNPLHSNHSAKIQRMNDSDVLNYLNLLFKDKIIGQTLDDSTWKVIKKYLKNDHNISFDGRKTLPFSTKTNFNYFSSRSGMKITEIKEFYNRFAVMMDDFAERDYFEEKLNFSRSLPSEGSLMESKYVNRKSRAHIGIEIYPFDGWPKELIKVNLILDSIEFLYKYVSKPGSLGYVTNHKGWNEEGYINFDQNDGKNEFREEINILLSTYSQEYYLDSDGKINFIGNDTLNFLDTNFPEYDENNIDKEIHLAIKWWKNRNQSIEDKKQAIIKLTGVLEYLKKDGTLGKILEKKDTSDLFNIANNFGIRHHNPDQKTDIDKEIWYDWIFQYYLNTCIGVIKLIEKNEP